VPKQRHKPNRKMVLKLHGASGNNLKDVDLEIPTGLFTAITGVSGSGKSTLINDTLYALAANEINGASHKAAAYREVEGLDLFDKVVDIDQSPIGRTPRSNPATYTGLFTPLRELFAQVPEARARGYSAGRFSFNVRGGRCEACQGDGLIKVEMHFLPDVYVPCDVCHGKRYNRETLEILYKGFSIHDVLDMTVEDAQKLFEPVPSIARKLDTLLDVGLSYVKLGQPATTLSGGEAQRVKLSKELSRRDTGRTLYILDEPTTGLHFHDIEHLLVVLHKLRDDGNTIVVIEHNLDVIKTADWVVDLGPRVAIAAARSLPRARRRIWRRCRIPIPGGSSPGRWAWMPSRRNGNPRHERHGAKTHPLPDAIGAALARSRRVQPRQQLQLPHLHRGSPHPVVREPGPRMDHRNHRAFAGRGADELPQADPVSGPGHRRVVPRTPGQHQHHHRPSHRR
jgi:energy-coupling factor transporter ATP-binding protein EcfA2